MTKEMNPWVSDEDFQEFEDLLNDEPEDERLVAPSSDTDSNEFSDKRIPSTPLPEYLDSEIADELSGDMVPFWLGMRWREIPAGSQADAWNGLRRWADWLVKEYQLPTSVVPPCWYKHPDIVAELYAAMCMEHKVWEESEPGLGPMMMWHPNLHQMIARLRESVTQSGCVSSGAHKAPMAVAGREPFELEYDESDWTQHVSVDTTSQQIARPDEGVLYIRASVVDNDGEVIAKSEPVGIRHHDEVEEPSVEVKYQTTNDDYSVLEARWKPPNNESVLIWETSTDRKTWETTETVTQFVSE